MSIPRDSYVQIPPFNNGSKTYHGGHDRINASFAFGGDGKIGLDKLKYGFRLLQQTIKQDFGISFDAGAIVDFEGFHDVVSALGGVRMCVDEKTTSIHIGHTKDGKTKVPFIQDGGHSFRVISRGSVSPPTSRSSVVDRVTVSAIPRRSARALASLCHWWGET